MMTQQRITRDDLEIAIPSASRRASRTRSTTRSRAMTSAGRRHWRVCCCSCSSSSVTAAASARRLSSRSDESDPWHVDRHFPRRSPGFVAPRCFKGLFGGSRGWLAAGLVLWVPILVKAKSRAVREDRRH